MVDGWTTYKLGSITKWNSGGTPRKSNPEYWGGSIPWISAKSLKGRFVYDSELKVTELGSKKGTKLAVKGSILLLVRGSGLFNDIPVAMTSRDVTFNQDVKCIVPTLGELSNIFLLYWFKGKKQTFTNMLEATSIGAGKFDMDRLFDLKVNLPPLKEQKAIASILSALDDKIELNLQMNKTLEKMAMALYKHWFVDFGPFQNGAFVDSELGKIPEGWEVKNLEGLAEIQNSKRVPLSTRQRSTRKGIYPYYGASGIIDSIDDYKFDGEFVIISEDGENLRSRKTPIAFRATGQFWVNNHAHILKGNYKGINDLIICHFAQLDMSPYLTGAVQPKLNKRNLLQVKIPIPIDSNSSKTVFEKFYDLSRLMINNNNENQTLTKLRDTLLPKLISGEIRVKDVAKLITQEL